MNLTWEQFQTGYESASPAVKQAIDNESIPAIVDSFLEQCPHTALTKPELIRLFAHFLLGNIDESTVRNELRLQGESVDSALASVLALQNQSVSAQAPKQADASAPAPTPRPVTPQPLTRDEVLNVLAQKHGTD